MDPSSFVRPTPSRPSAPMSAAAAVPQSAHQPPPPTGQPYVAPQPAAPVVPVAPVAPSGAYGGWAAPGGFGYALGARVNVTWSNGQRYPATVSQVSGTQCLVVFPDGQHHWVEMQYLTPA